MQNSWLAFDPLMEWALRLSLWRRRRFQISWWTRTSWCFNHTMLSVGQSHAAFNNFLAFGIPTCPILDQKTLDDLSVSILAVATEEFGTHLYNITPNVGCLMTGMSPDARALVYRFEIQNFELSWSWSLKICAPGQERLLRNSRIRTLTKFRPGIMEVSLWGCLNFCRWTMMKIGMENKSERWRWIKHTRGPSSVLRITWWEVHYLALKLANIAQVGITAGLEFFKETFADWWRKIWEHVVFWSWHMGDEFPGWWILMRIHETSWIELTFWLPGLYSACLHATLWCQHYVAAWQICKLRRLSTWAIAKYDSQTIQNWVSVRAGMLSWQGLQDLECLQRLQAFAQRKT